MLRASFLALYFALMISTFRALLTRQSRALRVLVSPLSVVRRKPVRLEEWETKNGSKKPKNNAGSNGSSISSSSSSRRRRGLAEIGAGDDESEADNKVRIKAFQGHEEQTGLVIERQGDRLLVQMKDGVRIVCSQRAKLCDSTIVVGDVVDFFIMPQNTSSSTTTSLTSSSGSDSDSGNVPVISIDMPDGQRNGNGQQGVVVSHHERVSLLQRPTSAGTGNIRQMKAIAANVEQLFVVIAASPHVPPSTIDRVLVAAHEYGMEAKIILNKVDMPTGVDEVRASLQHYPAIGYEILEVSVESGFGLDKLRDALRDRCTVFVGQSGVGKSSLVNALLPNAGARTGELVSNANIGAHTTSSARLFFLDGGGTIIDSPGIRELGLWHLSKESIKEGFVEIAALSKQCKFRNCLHTENSQGCAVLKGIDLGTVDVQRVQHYLDLIS